MSADGKSFITIAKQTDTYPGGRGSSFACLGRVVGVDEELALFTAENRVESPFFMQDLTSSEQLVYSNNTLAIGT